MNSETVNVSATVWLVTLAIVFVVTLADLTWAWFRRNTVTSLREAATWTAIYVSAAIADTFEVHHESPQVVVVINGEATYDASHMEITVAELLTETAANS
ncbi:MAG: DUF2847 family protein [Bacteroidetes bacterium]|nr:DUF2847 family protein [Bacteroidota bacterium]